MHARERANCPCYKNRMSTKTVVFADLTGSTAVFDALGNEKATIAVTKLTQWIGQVCVSHGGRVVKTLGDGVLALFPDGNSAAQACVAMQRSHSERILKWPPAVRMRIQIGMACGEVVEVDGDTYGDAVNVASRLSDLSGADQIWVNEPVVRQFPHYVDFRYRSLGPIPIRGKAEPQTIYKIEWQSEVASTFMTVQASLVPSLPAVEAASGRIDLSWLDVNSTFSSSQTPVHLGRIDTDFVVQDPRVSRIHAKIDWQNNTFVLSDMSSYGTWVRFEGSDTEVALRRQECILHGNGAIALGAPFSDFTVPTVAFSVTGAAGERSRI